MNVITFESMLTLPICIFCLIMILGLTMSLESNELIKMQTMKEALDVYSGIEEKYNKKINKNGIVIYGNILGKIFSKNDMKYNFSYKAKENRKEYLKEIIKRRNDNANENTQDKILN